jgi:hypothetical protein
MVSERLATSPDGCSSRVLADACAAGFKNEKEHVEARGKAWDRVTTYFGAGGEGGGEELVMFWAKLKRKPVV